MKNFKKIINKIMLGLKTVIFRKKNYDFSGLVFHIENIPIKKMWNWILIEISALLKLNKPLGYPPYLQIEPTAVCNLKCALCPVTLGLERKLSHMEFSVFKKLIDEVGDYLFAITLWDWGEPLLNPDLCKMIKYAKKKDIKVFTSTNGILLGKGQIPEELVKSQLDAIIVSVDGITENTYQKFRVGGKLSDVISGMEILSAMKNKYNSKTPVIIFQFIAMKHNEHEIPLLKEYAFSKGANAISIKTLNTYVDYYDEDYSKEFIPENIKLKRFKLGSNNMKPERIANIPCQALWKHPAIHNLGIVVPCCYDYSNKYRFGDLNRNTFKEIWKGPEFVDMRKKFKKNWQEINICRNCTYAFKGGSIYDEIIADAAYLKKEYN